MSNKTHGPRIVASTTHSTDKARSIIKNRREQKKALNIALLKRRKITPFNGALFRMIPNKDLPR